MNTKGIVKPKGTLNVLKKNGTTEDIITSIMQVVLDEKSMIEVQQFIVDNQIEANESDLKMLFEFVKNEITYIEDEFKQYTQYPSNLWHGKSPSGVKRAGDCKSKTAFIVACLRAIEAQTGGIDAIVVRLCTYDKYNKNVTHVYPMVMCQGKTIVLDAVFGRFNEQKFPLHQKTDKVLIFNEGLDYKSILKNI